MVNITEEEYNAMLTKIQKSDRSPESKINAKKVIMRKYYNYVYPEPLFNWSWR